MSGILIKKNYQLHDAKGDVSGWGFEELLLNLHSYGS